MRTEAVTASTDERLQRGLDLIPRLTEITGDQASGAVAEVYDDVQRTLRVPFVNFIFRVLANYPDFLVPAWRQIRPIVISRAFEESADDLRARALLQPDASARTQDWASCDGVDEVRPFTDGIHYVLPKLLLVATLLDASIGRPAPDSASAAPSTATIALGIADGMTRIGMVDPDKAEDPLSRLFNEIQQRHAHPGVATYYRALGHWPGLLQALWSYVEPVVGTAEYAALKRSLIEGAFDRATRQGWEAQVGQPDAPAEVADVLAVFRYRVIPDLLIDVVRIKALFDGPDAARRSRFSVA